MVMLTSFSVTAIPKVSLKSACNEATLTPSATCLGWHGGAPCHVWDLGRYRELSGSDSARAAAPANPVAFGRLLSALQGAFCGISNDCMEIDYLAGSLEKHQPAIGPAGI